MRFIARNHVVASMTADGEVLIGAVIAFGLVGVLLPVVPGSLVVGAAVALWAYLTGGGTAWLVLAFAAAALGTAAVAKWLVAERHLRGAGVPRKSMLIGGLIGIVGFFVIPVLGLLVGFVGGIYVAERRRLRTRSAARRSTVAALRASGLALLVELAGALLAAAAWLIGAVVT